MLKAARESVGDNLNCKLTKVCKFKAINYKLSSKKVKTQAVL